MKLQKNIHRISLASIALLMLAALLLGAVQPAAAATTAGIDILGVEKGQKVTIQASGMLRNTSYQVMLNKIGTKGEDGTVMGTAKTDSQGSFTVTVAIPAFLVGQSSVAIRIEAVNYPASYAYNWFYNTTSGTTSGGTTGSGSNSGSPTVPSGSFSSGSISITEVEEDNIVSVIVKNAPVQSKIAVWVDWRNRSGLIFGKYIGSVYSNRNGTIDETFTLPSAAHDRVELRIRFEGVNFQAYRWFLNVDSDGDTGSSASTGYTGRIPYLRVVDVNKGDTVTVEAYNFPKGEYEVLMAKMGNQGKNGTEVETFKVKKEGPFTLTLDIPSTLVNRDEIALRFQSTSDTSFYAYTWFENE